MDHPLGLADEDFFFNICDVITWGKRKKSPAYYYCPLGLADDYVTAN
jgi:hypothetical protein